MKRLDQEVMAQDSAFDQGLLCLSLIQQFLDNQQVVKWTCSGI